jgi:hypothetical protein
MGRGLARVVRSGLGDDGVEVRGLDMESSCSRLNSTSYQIIFFFTPDQFDTSEV